MANTISSLISYFSKQVRMEKNIVFVCLYLLLFLFYFYFFCIYVVSLSLHG